MTALAAAFAVVFVAELGDKSQILSLALSTRYRPAAVLGALAIVAGVLMGLSVTLGAALEAAVPTRALAVGGGVAFLGFALWAVRELREEGGGADDASDAGEAPGACVAGSSEGGDGPPRVPEGFPAAAAGAPARRGSDLLASVVALGVAELGDKTMLAAAALAATRGPLPVWIGATAGMVAASGLVVLFGRGLATRLPAHRLQLVSAVLFAAFGVAMLVGAALD